MKLALDLGRQLDADVFVAHRGPSVSATIVTVAKFIAGELTKRFAGGNDDRRRPNQASGAAAWPLLRSRALA
jgi:hypothetical protein